MSQVTINAPNLTCDDGRWTLSSEIGIAGSTRVVWYRTSGGPLACGPEPFVAAALLQASCLGVPLRIEGTASDRLLLNVPTILDVFHSWDNRYHRIPVTAAGRTPGEPGRPATACFLSGGVDSFYTLLKHQHEITTIIFVHGFDIALEDLSLRRLISRKIQHVAGSLGKALIEIETNVKQFREPYVSWEDYHGAALASVALALAPHCNKVYVAASRTYADLSPWGSHPIVDPLWSTESVAIIHDGCEATRLEKTQRIVRSDIVRRTLRVCWESPNGEYNCGRCRKCIFAKARLRAIGALRSIDTFDSDLDLRALERLPLDSPPIETTDLYRYVVRRGTDPALARALRRYLDERHYRGIRGYARRAAGAVRGRLLRFNGRGPSRGTA
jgi:7-cyano-7-deazaguanine synthase in queuosine biosynthesis